jgi:hypothetical protein
MFEFAERLAAERPALNRATFARALMPGRSSRLLGGPWYGPGT